MAIKIRLARPSAVTLALNFARRVTRDKGCGLHQRRAMWRSVSIQSDRPIWRTSFYKCEKITANFVRGLTLYVYYNNLAMTRFSLKLTGDLDDATISNRVTV